jgi:adenylate cyclase class IV
MPIESEITLLLCSQDPEAIADEIAGLKSIAGYLLEDKGSQMIRDVYFDTSLNPSLQERKLALRLRQINSDTLKITFKGASELRSDGSSNLQQREEVEEEWSKKGLENIVDQLKKESIAISEKPLQHEDNYSFKDIKIAIDVIKQLGLEKVIQDRTTKRIVRNVIPSNNNDDSQVKNSKILAELDIDAVTYCFEDNNKILLHEVEIEAKEDETLGVPDTISSALIAIFGSSVLERWPYSKIATGMAIREIIKKKRLFLRSHDKNGCYRLIYEDCNTLEQYLVELGN